MISEDRISHLAHRIIDRLWKDDLADFADEPRALQAAKDSVAAFFARTKLSRPAITR